MLLRKWVTLNTINRLPYIECTYNMLINYTKILTYL